MVAVAVAEESEMQVADLATEVEAQVTEVLPVGAAIAAATAAAIAAVTKELEMKVVASEVAVMEVLGMADEYGMV